jgi:hypothetical protein
MLLFNDANYHFQASHGACSLIRQQLVSVLFRPNLNQRRKFVSGENILNDSPSGFVAIVSGILKDRKMH